MRDRRRSSPSCGALGRRQGLSVRPRRRLVVGSHQRAADDGRGRHPPNEHRRNRAGHQGHPARLDSADKAWCGAPKSPVWRCPRLPVRRTGPRGSLVLDHALQKRVTFAARPRGLLPNVRVLRGSTRAGELLRAAADRSASASERLFVRLLKDAGIRGLPASIINGTRRIHTNVDVAFVTRLLAIEIDGWAWHHHPDRFSATAPSRTICRGRLDRSEVHLVRPHGPSGRGIRDVRAHLA